MIVDPSSEHGRFHLPLSSSTCPDPNVLRESGLLCPLCFALLERKDRGRQKRPVLRGTKKRRYSLIVLLPSQPWRQGRSATSRPSATAVYTTEQTRIFAAGSILLEVFTCYPKRRKKWPEVTESRGLSFCIAPQREVSSRRNERSSVGSRGGRWSSGSRSLYGQCFVLFSSVCIDIRVLQ
jgi:hypothetical protein